MKLDFSAIRGTTSQKPTEAAVEAFERLDGVEMPIEVEPARKPAKQATEGDRKLLTAYQQERADHERILRVCKDYQRNTLRAEGLTTEILKGARAGEPITALLLKAGECISLMTGDSVFYSQLEGDIKGIYGAGLLEPDPLQLELEDVQGRLQKLQESLQRDGESEDSKRRIETAIEAHKKRANQLKTLIERETQL